MKIKDGFAGAMIVGLTAGVLRIFQYLLVIDSEGYNTRGTLTNVTNVVLLVLLIGGLIWCIIGALYKRAPFTLPEQQDRVFQILFVLLGFVALADGLLRLASIFLYTPPERVGWLAAFGHIDGIPGIVAALCCLLGAAGWFLLARGQAKSIAALLPVLQMAAAVLSFFWSTYKYIHVTEYALAILGLCTVLLFTLVLMRGMAGVPVSRGRLQRWACLTAVMVPTAFLAPLVGLLRYSFRGDTLLLFVEGFLFLLLAYGTTTLPQQKKTAPQEPVTGPDLSALNHYITDIPAEISADENNEEAPEND